MELFCCKMSISNSLQNIMILGDFCADGLYVTHKQMKGLRIRSDKNFHWLIGDDMDTTSDTSKEHTYDRHGTLVHSTPSIPTRRIDSFSVPAFLLQNRRVRRWHAGGCRADVGQALRFPQGVSHDWRNGEASDTSVVVSQIHPNKSVWYVAFPHRPWRWVTTIPLRWSYVKLLPSGWQTALKDVTPQKNPSSVLTQVNSKAVIYPAESRSSNSGREATQVTCAPSAQLFSSFNFYCGTLPL